MKNFIKQVLAVLVALFICSVISFLMFVFIIGFIVGSSSDSYILKENTVLTLKLEGELMERTPEPNPFTEILQMYKTKVMGLDDILSSIKKAKENDKIKGIYIHTGIFIASPASLQEIRDALTDFKESGKFVVSYADTYMQGGYYLASVSDKIVINPKGNLDFHGMSVSPVFFKGLLDKIGVEMQVFKVGTYKSAVEPYISKKMSDANKEQSLSFAKDIWENIVTAVSAERNISPQQLNSLADTMLFFQDTKFLVDNRIVDTLMYETEMNEYLKTLAGIDKDAKLPIATVNNMTSVPLNNINKTKDQIAILYAQGAISSTSSNNPDASEIIDSEIVKELQKLQDDDNVKAVVFRVNSPGGSAFASEQIWKAVTDLKSKKPIVVSMGDYAASGGYYISCNASKIIAQPTTLTGSIGIFGIFPNIQGLTEKIGISFDNVKTNKYADFGDYSRPMREDEKRILQTYIERGYDLFLTRCAEGRGMSKDSLAAIAEGRVWTGNQALKLGLVDGMGGIGKAIQEAASLANIDKYVLQDYPKKKNFIEVFLNTQKEEAMTRLMKEYLGTNYYMVKTMRDIENQDYVQAVMPYRINTK